MCDVRIMILINWRPAPIGIMMEFVCLFELNTWSFVCLIWLDTRFVWLFVCWACIRSLLDHEMINWIVSLRVMVWVMGGYSCYSARLYWRHSNETKFLKWTEEKRMINWAKCLFVCLLLWIVSSHCTICKLMLMSKL